MSTTSTHTHTHNFLCYGSVWSPEPARRRRHSKGAYKLVAHVLCQFCELLPLQWFCVWAAKRRIFSAAMTTIWMRNNVTHFCTTSAIAMLGWQRSIYVSNYGMYGKQRIAKVSVHSSMYRTKIRNKSFWARHSRRRETLLLLDLVHNMRKEYCIMCCSVRRPATFAYVCAPSDNHLYHHLPPPPTTTITVSPFK